jgi:predicted NACHT family NTPase
VFADLRIAPSAGLTRPHFDPIAVRELFGPQQIWDLLRSTAVLRDGVALAIVGPPRSGKSTLLQHVTLTLAANRHRRYRSRPYFPILLAIREHAASIIADDQQTLAQLAPRHFSVRRLFPNLDPPPGWFERRLQRGDSLILLDGLDEVADADQRRTIAAWVEWQVRMYSTCRFIVAARPQGYRDAPLEHANIVEVLPFTAEQVRTFVSHWYLANEIHAAMGKVTVAVQHGRIRSASG